jgi:hypothetical protein
VRPAAVRILTPGPRPARSHRALFDASERGAGDTVVIVDQFEEAFTLCQDARERADFVSLLLKARDPAARLRVVLAVRADFFGHLAAHRDLADALRAATLLVGPMTPEELREVIVKPAAAAGLTVERALTARLMREVDGEAGGLPLLSHVLLETWRRRQGRLMTLAAYEAAGGLQGAVAQSAEALYTRLPAQQQTAVRRTLLRLIAPGDGTPDTRRPADRTELGAGTPGTPAAEALEELARVRLVTLDQDAVHLTHEALITACHGCAGGSTPTADGCGCTGSSPRPPGPGSGWTATPAPCTGGCDWPRPTRPSVPRPRARARTPCSSCRRWNGTS